MAWWWIIFTHSDLFKFDGPAEGGGKRDSNYHHQQQGNCGWIYIPTIKLNWFKTQKFGHSVGRGKCVATALSVYCKSEFLFRVSFFTLSRSVSKQHKQAVHLTRWRRRWWGRRLGRQWSINIQSSSARIGMTIIIIISRVIVVMTVLLIYMDKCVGRGGGGLAPWLTILHIVFNVLRRTNFLSVDSQFRV